jgi:hypothetical protein
LEAGREGLAQHRVEAATRAGQKQKTEGATPVKTQPILPPVLGKFLSVEIQASAFDGMGRHVLDWAVINDHLIRLEELKQLGDFLAKSRFPIDVLFYGNILSVV